MKKKLLSYIASNVFAMLGLSFYILVDTFFIARVDGSNGITALNLALPVYGIIYAIGAMIGVGSAIRYSLETASKSKGADTYFSNAIMWDILISLIFVFLGIFCTDDILILMGADKTILNVGFSYLRIALCFAPCFMLNYAFTAFVRNDKAPKIAMIATVFSSLFNVFFDYILMFPFGLGISGAALATGISPIVSIAICMIHYLSKKNTITFRIMIPSINKLIKSCKVGVYAFIGEIASGITTLVFNFILLSLGGNIAVAAYGIIANIALVGTSIFNGVSQGLQPLASAARGKNDMTSLKKIYINSLEVAMILAIISVCLILIFNSLIVSIFNSEGSISLANYGVHGLKIYSIGFLIAAINIVRAGYFSAIGKGMESSIISILRGIVAIVLFAFLLSKLCGITGVWLAFPVAEIFTLLITFKIKK